ncbi:MAG: hypothetical protein MUO94_08575, partial [Thermoplasmata archaeon]|nr:hypothetical protein [Thermoplasmata archaeon]
GFMFLYAWHSTQTEVMVGIAIMGSGLAFAMVGSINMIIISTPKEETGISTGMNMIFRITGSVVGSASAAVIIASNSVAIPGTGISVPDDHAYQLIFLISSIFMGIAVVLSLFLRNNKALPEK